MLLDTLDLQILKEFCKLKKGQEKSLTDIVKLIYKSHGAKEYTTIKRKIIRLSKYNLFEIGKNGQTSFNLNTNKVFFKRFSLPTRRRGCIAVLLGDKWSIFEI